MKEYVLNYYPQFKCIAEKCKHTCCAGWDMKIDAHTLNNYLNQASCISKTLKNGINIKKSKFRADKNGRCAFLNDKGLCDIIIKLGEENLCQVCRDHPRFRSFFDNSIELGLGFCCEQATKIILSYSDKIQPILVYDDNNDITPSFIQQHVLSFRQNVLEIIQDRTKNINERIENLVSLCNLQIDTNTFKKIIKRYISFENLDKSWRKRLKKLQVKQFNYNTSDNLSIYCEQFFSNSIFRHLSGAEDVMSARARLVACLFSWWIIKSIFESENDNQNSFNLICDIVRAYSAEVEYSQKNLTKLYNFSSLFV